MFKPTSKIYKILVAIFSVVLTAFIGYLIVQAGSLNPPGSPTSTMHDLDEIAGSGFTSSTDSLEALRNRGDAAWTTAIGFPSSTDYTSARATKLDNLDAAISSRAEGPAHECSDSDATGTICRGGMKFATGLVVMPGGCDGTTTNPVCNGTTDSVTTTWAAVVGSDEPADSNTDGWSNTGNLVYNTLQTNDAAQYCWDMVYQGYSDWYLPARYQLITLYGQKTTVGGFYSSYYWSSTEHANVDGAWLQGFTDGTQAYNPKTGGYYVRCIRSY